MLIFWIICVLKWWLCIMLFCIPNSDGWVKEEQSCDWVMSWSLLGRSYFLSNTSFDSHSKNDSHSHLHIFHTFSQKWIQWAYYIKENNWQDLLLMITFELSGENNFRTLVSCTMSLTASQYLKTYVISGDINKFHF